MSSKRGNSDSDAQSADNADLKKRKLTDGKKTDNTNNQDIEEEQEVDMKLPIELPCEYKQTGNSFRDKIQDLVANSFQNNYEKDGKYKYATECAAVLIESSLYCKYKSETSKEYRSAARDIIANLKDKKNITLSNKILTRQIPPEIIPFMPITDLAADYIKETRNMNDKYNIEASQYYKPLSLLPTTDMYKCSKCNNRKTTYRQMQTRSADEPMTTFVTCVVCNNRWKC